MAVRTTLSPAAMALFLQILAALLTTCWASSPFTGTKKTQAIDEHNKWRRAEAANDMMELSWHDAYASSAAVWATKCKWAHKIEPPTTGKLIYEDTGQNMWFGSGSLDIAGAVKAWYDEKNYYNYQTKACDAGQMCGHYTQVVNSASYLLGCAEESCSPLYDEDGTSVKAATATLLVCNYGPSGNRAEEPHPFYKGAACSNCSNWQAYCNNGLCHNCDSGSCECKLTCKNCGVPKNDSCACECPTGWGGQDCSRACKDVHSNCGNGWYNAQCNLDPIIDYIPRWCPALCKLCTGGTPSGQQCDSTSMSPESSSADVTSNTVINTTSKPTSGGNGGNGGDSSHHYGALPAMLTLSLMLTVAATVY